MKIKGFIQPTENTQALFVEIAAIRARRRSHGVQTEEYISLTSDIGRLTDQIRRIRANEQRDE